MEVASVLCINLNSEFVLKSYSYKSSHTRGWFDLIGEVVSLAEGVHDEGKGSPCVHNHPILILNNLGKKLFEMEYSTWQRFSDDI